MKHTPGPFGAFFAGALIGSLIGIFFGSVLAVAAWLAFPGGRPAPPAKRPPPPAILPRETSHVPAAPAAPAAPPGRPATDREGEMLREVSRLAGLERRVDPVDGKTVLLELLPGYRELGGDEDAGLVRLELEARVRADATRGETLQRLIVEVRLDERDRAVRSARVVGRLDADDAALEELIRKLNQ